MLLVKECDIRSGSDEMNGDLRFVRPAFNLYGFGNVNENMR